MMRDAVRVVRVDVVVVVLGMIGFDRGYVSQVAMYFNFVEGAGLALGMALRPGAYMIEVYSHKEYWTFSNSVALIDNVSYTAFRCTCGRIP